MSKRSTSGSSNYDLDNTRDRNEIRKEKSEPHRMQPSEELSPEGEYFCKECKAVFHTKAWHNDERRYKVLSADPSLGRTCPACRKAALDLPEGIVTLSALESLDPKRVEELYNLVRNIGDRARKRDPMDRIIKFTNKGSEAIIYTSENQLAVAIGNEVKRAYGGDLNIDFGSRDKEIARVVWIAKEAA